ncbi:MAG: FapA family protein [Leptospirales bacterium]|nr:FapA family protein [Leptospirales bacterium]
MSNYIIRVSTPADVVEKMRKIVFYFNDKAKKIFEKQVKDGVEKTVLSSPHNFVSRNEIIARVVNAETDEEVKSLLDAEKDPGLSYYMVSDYFPLKIGDGTFFDDYNNVYRASSYGFVICVEGRLSVLSPVSVTKDKQKAFITVLPTKSGKIPTTSEVFEMLNFKKITTLKTEIEIAELLTKIPPKGPAKLLVAEGRPAIDGHPEYYKPFIDYAKKAGAVKSDGSIDFKEVGSVVQVSTGQEILQRIPGVKPIVGYDVFGNQIQPASLSVSGYKPGENVVPSEFDSDILVSSIDGVLKVANRKVSVLKVVIVNGNLDYKTGNIDFNGSVTITGSVLPGFKIKATGDVVVQESLEDAVIESGGDVKIKGGIVGKDSVKITCAGNLEAKYILNATVEAGGDIIVEDSIINSNVFANHDINIEKNGKLIGGTATAQYCISVKVAGAPSNPPTVLNVGRNLAIERELDAVSREMNLKKEEVNEIMRQLRINFGEGVFKEPQKIIATLIPAKKKLCLELLQQLSAKNAELKELSLKYDEISQKLVLEKEPFVVAYDKVYPGVVLNIKKNVLKVEREYSNVKFYDDMDEKRVRFTVAPSKVE